MRYRPLGIGRATTILVTMRALLLILSLAVLLSVAACGFPGNDFSCAPVVGEQKAGSDWFKTPAITGPGGYKHC